MDNYIIRIYRRDEEEPNEVVGVVELVETEKKQKFKNMDELVRILRGPKGKLPQRGKQSD